MSFWWQINNGTFQIVMENVFVNKKSNMKTLSLP